jgi:hypothetical protein
MDGTGSGLCPGVGSWYWWCRTLRALERIVLLDFIHRLVSQKTNKIEELKIISISISNCVCVYFILVFWPPLHVVVCE